MNDELVFPWKIGDVLNVVELNTWSELLCNNLPIYAIPNRANITISKIGNINEYYKSSYIPFSATFNNIEYGFSYEKCNKYKLIKQTNMEQKELKITIPEGYEIDKEKSTFENIVFKPIKKVLSYDDVAKELLYGKDYNFIASNGEIKEYRASGSFIHLNNCVTEKQAQKLLAINNLMNCAKYLNGNWKPDLGTVGGNMRYYIYYRISDDRLFINNETDCCSHGAIYFKTSELARQAIEILGKETVKLALSVDY